MGRRSLANRIQERLSSAAATKKSGVPMVGSQWTPGGGDIEEPAKADRCEEDESVNDDMHAAPGKRAGELTDGDQREVRGRRIMCPDGPSSSWSRHGAQHVSPVYQFGTTCGIQTLYIPSRPNGEVKSRCQSYLGAAPSLVMMRQRSLDE
ncbi:hypothetical protein DL93DRAFT_464547 [Clavulina sp. PMI_390]|nr:hypothetical protein DL93DRAFT_464547 [Clavulina sp. PMI_390]